MRRHNRGNWYLDLVLRLFVGAVHEFPCYRTEDGQIRMDHADSGTYGFLRSDPGDKRASVWEWHAPIDTQMPIHWHIIPPRRKPWWLPRALWLHPAPLEIAITEQGCLKYLQHGLISKPGSPVIIEARDPHTCQLDRGTITNIVFIPAHPMFIGLKSAAADARN